MSDRGLSRRIVELEGEQQRAQEARSKIAALERTISELKSGQRGADREIPSQEKGVVEAERPKVETTTNRPAAMANEAPLRGRLGSTS